MKKGKLIAFENRIATGSPQKVQYAVTMTGGIDVASTASAVPPYEIPNRRIVYNLTEAAVPIGMWRSVGASHNAFVVETFVDELAACDHRVQGGHVATIADRVEDVLHTN